MFWFLNSDHKVTVIRPKVKKSPQLFSPNPYFLKVSLGMRPGLLMVQLVTDAGRANGRGS